MAFDNGCCKYSCSTATETLEWIRAIIDFIKPYSFFWEAHVVNFFTDRLWEAVDKQWIDCLRNESVENLLQIPSGGAQDHWPSSLKKFILRLSSLAFPREQADLKKILPNLEVSLLNNVLAQGMNQKKRHEVEALAAIVSSVARDVKTSTIIDVGAGQGYLAQVLSFEYRLSVIAIDASSHHGKITDARAERIKKHYAARMCKSSSGGRDLTVPKTVTCRVLSTDMLRALCNSNDIKRPSLVKQCASNDEDHHDSILECSIPSPSSTDGIDSLLLTGLHACGDLSVTMLRTFLECEDVKAVVSVGCCYNLLSEDQSGELDSQSGFPISRGVRSTGLHLGKSSRDLACQSADRWKDLGKDAGLHNFELHAFRAAFQMVLLRFFPETLRRSPTVGRQGKALRRRQQGGMLESTLHPGETTHCTPLSSPERFVREGNATQTKTKCGGTDTGFDPVTSCFNHNTIYEKTDFVNKYSLFEKFCQSGIRRLNLNSMHDVDFAGIWKEAQPFSELIGPYWSLRAALGPVLETLILLDRLLFLQEQGNSVEVVMLPIFNPALSPRNVALVAKKVQPQVTSNVKSQSSQNIM